MNHHRLSELELHQLVRRLERGTWGELTEQLLRGKKPVWAVQEALRDVSRTGYSDLEKQTDGRVFNTPLETYDMLWEEAKKANWPFTPEQLNRLYGEVRKHQNHRNTVDRLLTFDLWFGDHQSSFAAHVNWMTEVHGEVVLQDFNRDVVAYVRRADRGVMPQIRVVQVCMNMNPGGDPLDNAWGETYAGFEALAVYATHVGYVDAVQAGLTESTILKGLRSVTGGGLEVALRLTVWDGKAPCIQGYSLEGGAIVGHQDGFAVITRPLSEYF